MNYTRNIVVVMALLSSSLAFGQLTADPEDRRDPGKDPLRTQDVNGQPLPFGQRLRFGGGINGFNLGNPFSIGLSPVIAYQTTEHLLLGVGATYSYTRVKPPYNPSTINQYGGRGFVMYEFIPSIVQNLYLHGEVQTTTYQQRYDQSASGTYNGVVTAPLIGLTYMQPISRRFGINLTALYNLSYDRNDPLSSVVYGGSPFVLRLAFF